MLRFLTNYAQRFLASWAYSFQTFSIGEVLGASKMDQIEVNIRDHQHGVASVSILTRESSAGMVLLTSGTASATATLDIVLTSYTAYRGLMFLLSGFLPVTDNTDLWMRFSTDGGSTFDATGYSYNCASFPDTLAGPAGLQSGSDTKIIIGTGESSGPTGIGNVATEGYNGLIELLNQASTTLWSRVNFRGVAITSAGVTSAIFGGGARETAQDTDAVRFMFSSGNIASGNYAVYGIN